MGLLRDKDLPGISLLRTGPDALAPATVDALAQLPLLYGSAVVIGRARSLLPALPGVVAALDTLESLLADLPSYRLSQEQVESAWNYAYRFFFDFPRPFPWRLMKFWPDLQEWPVARVLSDEGRAEFGQTFDYLSGQPLTWA